MNLYLLIIGFLFNASHAQKDGDEEARKILSSSVVTSVSVVKDPVNASKATFTDAVGRPLPKPQQATKLASPIELLNPDRYEFYTFDDSGDLVKRLMTMEEIKGIIATSGDDAFTFDNLSELLPEKKVSDIVSNVQNVLKEEMESHKMPDTNQLFDTPDVSDTWSMILPAIFGNSGEEIKPDRTVSSTPPETIVLTQTEATPKISPVTSTKVWSKIPTKTTLYPAPTKVSTKLVTKTTTRPTKPTPNVEIYPNSQIIDKPASKISPDAVLKSTSKTPATPIYISTVTQLLNTAKPVPLTSPVTLKPKVTVSTTKYVKTTTAGLKLTPYKSTTTPLPTTVKIKSPSKTTVSMVHQTKPLQITILNTTKPPATTKSTRNDSTVEGSSTEYIIVPTKYYIRPITNVTSLLNNLILTTSSVSTSRPTTTTNNYESEKNTTGSISPVNTTTETIKSTAESLEKLLLSANSIYDINSRLTGKTDPPETTTLAIETTTFNDTFDQEELNASNLTLVQSIEQLLAQAVGNISEVIIDQQQLLSNFNSSFDTSTFEPTETTLSDTTVTTEVPDLKLDPVTEETTTLTDSTDLDDNLIYSSTIIPLSDRFYEDPHILNITIIRRKNNTKPAKADLSQELEALKLATKLSNKTQEYPETTPVVKNSSKENTWTLVSTIAPHSKLTTVSDKPTLAPILESSPSVDLVAKPLEGFGLEESTSKLDADVYQFVQLCNELAFGFWKTVTTGISSARSVIVSPFAATSLLAMVFLGARGATSGEMNEILKLDNMVTFNPHLIFKNVTESIQMGPEHGIAISTIVRQLYGDKTKENILNFYKERARYFYDGHVEEVDFTDIADTIRRRTNLLVKKQTGGKVPEFIKENTIKANPPLAAMSANVFQTDCTKGYVRDRDGELHFIVLPSIRQRRLIPIPAVVYKDGFLAGYEPSLDATAVALGEKEQIVSTIFVLPGRPGVTPPGDSLSRLEKRLVESSFQKGAWARLLRSLIPRDGLEIQIPRFSHRSIINATEALKQMGLKNLFDLDKADLRGLNGVAHDLHLSDMLQVNSFSVCRYGNQPDGQHTEFYPATASRSLRKHRLLDGDASLDDLQLLQDPLYATDYLSVPLSLRPRQARVPQIPRLKLDRPFLYFVRHNPTGLILHMGRFNPRLLP